jgi:hypothetical protein
MSRSLRAPRLEPRDPPRAASHGSAPRGSDRTSAEYVYDASGRQTKPEFLSAQTPNVATAYGIEGREIGYGVPGAATVTTRYDDRDQPVDAVFHDATHALLRTNRVHARQRRARRDRGPADGAAGPAHFKGVLGALSGDDYANIAAMVGAAFGSVVTTFTYDSAGRLVEGRH